MNEYNLLVDSAARQHLAEVKAEQERGAVMIERTQKATKNERRNVVLSLIAALHLPR